jgi:hypothetical protein
MALTTSRKPTDLRRPVLAGSGNNGSTCDHFSSVKSVGWRFVFFAMSATGHWLHDEVDHCGTAAIPTLEEIVSILRESRTLRSVEVRGRRQLPTTRWALEVGAPTAIAPTKDQIKDRRDRPSSEHRQVIVIRV